MDGGPAKSHRSRFRSRFRSGRLPLRQGTEASVFRSRKAVPLLQSLT